MRRLLCGTLAVAAALTAAPAASAKDETVCRGALSAARVDELVVPAGAHCALDHVTVKKSVEVEDGASVVAGTVAIGGNLAARDAADVSLSGVRVDGNVKVRGATGDVLVTASDVRESVVVREGSGSVAIVGNVTTELGGVSLGSVRVEENVFGEGDQLEVSNNTIAGGALIRDNRGAGAQRVTGNAVGGVLACLANADKFDGAGNVFAAATGQCAPPQPPQPVVPAV